MMIALNWCVYFADGEEGAREGEGAEGAEGVQKRGHIVRELVPGTRSDGGIPHPQPGTPRPPARPPTSPPACAASQPASQPASQWWCL